MPTVIPKQPKKEREQITIRMDRDVLQTLEHYCRYLESGRDYVINQCLTFIFAKTSHSACGLPARESRIRLRSMAPRWEAPTNAVNHKVRPAAVQGRLSITE